MGEGKVRDLNWGLLSGRSYLCGSESPAGLVKHGQLSFTPDFLIL